MKESKFVLKKRIFEAAKSLFLLVLIVNSVYFAVQIFDRQYNIPIYERFLTGITANFKTANNAPEQISPNAMFLSSIDPGHITVTFDHNPLIFYEASEEYGMLYSHVLKVISLFYTERSASAAQTTEDEWNQVLIADNVHIKYIIPISMSFMRKLYSSPANTGENIDLYSEILITESNGVTSIYIKDETSGIILKSNVDYTGLSSCIEEYAQNNTSYERPQIVLLDIPPDEDDVKRLLAAFGFDPSFTRQYTEKDDTKVFVDENSTLKLRMDGSILYNSIDSAREPRDNSRSAFNAVNSLMDIVRSVIHTNADYGLKLVKPFDTNNNDFTLNFDYYYKGHPVIVENVLTAHIKDGYLTYFSYNKKDILEYDETVDYENSIIMTCGDDGVYRTL